MLSRFSLTFLAGVVSVGLVSACGGGGDIDSSQVGGSFACMSDEQPNAIAGSNAKPMVIPTLQIWNGGTGTLTLGSNSRIVVEPASVDALHSTANLFQAQLKNVTGLSLPVVTDVLAPQENDVALSLTPCGGTQQTLGSEGYSLYVQKGVTLRANNAAGVFYATQTILQMLSLDTTNAAPNRNLSRGYSVDYPRYEERSVLFDVGRKFADKQFLEAYIKFMGWYKLNTLHLHLNDQARGADGNLDLRAFRLKSDNPAFAGLIPSDGQYYTKQDWAELEDVAAAYGVHIVPEFDTPGHAGAFVIANPAIAYAGDKTGGTLDPTNPATLAYVESVINEFLPWFRSSRFHIGGDEIHGNIPVSSEVSYLNQLGQFLISKGKTVEMWGDTNYLPALDTRFVIEDWYASSNELLNTYYGSNALLNWKQQGYKWTNASQDWYVVPGSPVIQAIPGLNNPSGIKGDTLYTNWGNTAVLGQFAPAGGQISVWNDNVLTYSYTYEKEVNDLIKDAVPAAGQMFWRGQEQNPGGTTVEYPTLRKSVAVLQYGPDVSMFANSPIPTD